MAKTTGALLSLGARGTIAKTLTFAGWRGVPYARQRVVPANPQSTAQTTTRSTFANASAIWKGAGAVITAPWNRFAVGQPLTGRNAFMSEFVSRLRGDADLTEFLMAPSAKGGTPLDGITPTPGDGQIALAVTPPTPPTGWTLTGVRGGVILDQDPETMTDFTIVTDTNDVDPYGLTFTGLTNDSLYVVAAWPQWERPDGSIAYGQAISTTSTPTAA